MRSKGFVDYDRVADRYQQGRALPAGVLARWGRAVQPYLPPGRCRVVDVGAGTGIFAAVWPRWTKATVVAVEPSESMVRTGRATDPTIGYVRGMAEALPLADASTDVAWLSTTLHHFRDIGRGTRELARVLRPGGRALVRTYVPGRTELPLAHIPARAKFEARVHSEDELVRLFDEAGFELAGAAEVLERLETYAEAADWAERMRHADSFLTALSDDEMAEGLAFLRATPSRVVRSELTLVAFTRL